MRDAVSESRINCVFGNVTFDAPIVVRAVAAESAALGFHFVRGLPGARDDFADAAHRLGITAHHADGSEVVQNIFGGDGFAANPAFRERDIFGQARVEVMTDHQHVEMFVDRVDSVGTGWICGTGQDVRFAANTNDVGRMAAAGAFGVISVDDPAVDGFERGFDKTGLVEGVRVDGDLDVVLVCDFQAAIDCGRRGPPVFVKLEADGARENLFGQTLRQRCVAFAGETEV